ncbi:hypothetical protein HN51_015523 [Arachis hypogaea]
MQVCNRKSESEAVGDSEGTFSVLHGYCGGSTAIARPVIINNGKLGTTEAERAMKEIRDLSLSLGPWEFS